MYIIRLPCQIYRCTEIDLWIYIGYNIKYIHVHACRLLHRRRHRRWAGTMMYHVRRRQIEDSDSRPNRSPRCMDYIHVKTEWNPIDEMQMLISSLSTKLNQQNYIVVVSGLLSHPSPNVSINYVFIEEVP